MFGKKRCRTCQAEYLNDFHDCIRCDHYLKGDMDEHLMEPMLAICMLQPKGPHWAQRMLSFSVGMVSPSEGFADAVSGELLKKDVKPVGSSELSMDFKGVVHMKVGATKVAFLAEVNKRKDGKIKRSGYFMHELKRQGSKSFAGRLMFGELSLIPMAVMPREQIQKFEWGDGINHKWVNITLDDGSTYKFDSYEMNNHEWKKQQSIKRVQAALRWHP